MKRKVARLDIERREIDVNRTRLEREIIALKKHIETVSFIHPEIGMIRVSSSWKTSEIVVRFH